MKKIVSIIAALLMITLPLLVSADTGSSIATPNISVTATSTGSATFTLKTLTSGTTIYYTTNGGDPTISSTKYKGSVKVTKTCEVRAVAYANGEYSDVGYYLVTVAQPQVATPVPKSTSVEAGKKITLSCSTGSAAIYYTTDGSTPSESNGTRYTSSGITVSESCFIRAVGVRSGYLNSRVAEAYVEISTLPKPSYKATRTSNGSIKITLSGPYSSGCTYYYTTDGSTPTPKTSTYCKKYTSSGIVLSKACTVKFIACKNGYAPSEVSGLQVSGPKCASPALSSKTNIAGGVNIKLSASTSGATIYYTLDGSIPTTSDKKYTSSGIPITEEGSTILYAIAVKSGYSNSDPQGFKVTVNRLSKPSATYVTSSTTSTSRKVKLTGPSGAYIYYTLDGSDPTTSSKKVSSGGTFTISSSCTLRAMSVKSGFANSAIYEAPLKCDKTVATPTVSESKYTDYNRVVLKCSTSGATIYYTTDGRDPLIYGNTCTSGTTLPNITRSCVLKAVAVRDGYENSNMLTYKVTLKGDTIVILGLDEEESSSGFGLQEVDTTNGIEEVLEDDGSASNVALPNAVSVDEIPVSGNDSNDKFIDDSNDLHIIEL